MTDTRQLFINTQIINRFGSANAAILFALIEQMKKHDSVIEKNINNHLENVLLLSRQQFEELTPFLEKLIKTSHFASSFFIEKIPTLLSVDLYDEFVSLILEIKDYNARNLSIMLGSSELITDDLDDILLEVDINYYRRLIQSVRKNNQKLQAICASLLIHGKGISKVVSQGSLSKYIAVCIAIYEIYGFDMADLFIKRSQTVLPIVKLKDVLATFKKISANNLGYLEFFLYYPETSIYPSQSRGIYTKSQVLALLKKDIRLIPKKVPSVLKDKYIISMLVNWNNFSDSQKSNMLAQLSKKDFIAFMLSNKKTATEVKQINTATQNNWFIPWQYPVAKVDGKYIYAEIKKTIYSGKNYSRPSEEIYDDTKQIMQRYKNKKIALIKIFKILQGCVISKDTQAFLIQLENLLLHNNPQDEMCLLSDGKLFLTTWARDPWIDYSRSDELYACTNIGDYASYNSPSFLADLNISNLDIWSNGERRGRIYLYLMHDLNNELYLLVDRINGSDRLIRHKNQLATIFNAIKEYAKTTGIKKIFYNSAISFNNTPKQIVNYAAATYGEESHLYLKRYIFEGAVKKTLLQAKASFLESLEYKEAGVVKGVFVS